MLEIQSVDNSVQSGIWNPGLLETIQSVARVLPDAVWKLVKPQFYVTFWQLSLYDIFVPTARYKAEISRLKAIVEKMANERDIKKKRERDRFSLMIPQVR